MSVRPATRRGIEAALAQDAVCRGYLASHLPMAPVEPIVPVEEARRLGEAASYRDWVEHFAAALTRRTDERDIKIPHTCWREWQRTGDDLYRRAVRTRLAAAPEETSP